MDFLKRYIVVLLAMLTFVAYFGNQVWQQRFGDASSTEVFLVWLAGSAIVAALAVTISNYRLVPLEDVQAYKQQQSRNQTRQSQTEKRKRDRLDRVLRDLSDDELHVLRQRLEDGSIDDDVLHHRIADPEHNHIRR
jgi:NAD/NADP transhydrogenase alpha subunit